METPVPAYELTYRLEGLPESVVDALYDDFDCLVGHDHDGTPYVMVTAEGANIVDASKSIVARMVGVGACPREVRPDLVDRAAIAERCGVTRAAVGYWIRGSRGPGSFPATFSDVPGGVWLWGEILPWLRTARQDVDGMDSPKREDLARINYALLKMRDRHLVAEAEVPVRFVEQPVTARTFGQARVTATKSAAASARTPSHA